jgi:alkylation response protein AidB-like acyl-CoA dehydrogenase
VTVAGGDRAVVERARELAGLARAEAEAIERDRRLPDALVEALREGGLFELWVPRELGGLDADLATFMAVVQALSEGEAAAGWVVMIAAETNALAAWMPRETAETIFAGARPICVGALQPAAGTLRRVEGGYVADGQWAFGSGLPHADWVISRGRLLGPDGSPELDERGQPRTRAFAVPADETELVDTWSVPGLLGTGSFDYAMRGVSVREELTFDLGAPWTAGPRATLPIRAHFQIGHGAHALGVARQAAEAFDEIIGRPEWSRRPAEEIALAQANRGEAEALIASAGAWLDRLLAEVWQRAVEDEPQPAETWSTLTLAVAYTVRSCVRAADLLFEAAGAQSLYRPNRLERAWRDLRAAGQHLHAKQRHYTEGGAR